MSENLPSLAHVHQGIVARTFWTKLRGELRDAGLPYAASRHFGAVRVLTNTPFKHGVEVAPITARVILGTMIAGGAELGGSWQRFRTVQSASH